MQQLIIEIKDESRQQFILELLEAFDFVEIVGMRARPPEQEEFVKGIEDALKEVEAHQKGEKQLQTAKEFLDEL